MQPRLIEKWLPINEISTEAIRERWRFASDTATQSIGSTSGGQASAADCRPVRHHRCCR